MHMRFENYNRTKVYRVWTLGNFQGNASDVTPSNGEIDLMPHDISGRCEVDEQSNEQSAGRSLLLEKLPSGLVEGALINDLLQCATNDTSMTSTEEEVRSQVINRKIFELDSRDDKACNSMPKIQSFHKYPTAVTVDTAQREERILGRLKVTSCHPCFYSFCLTSNPSPLFQQPT